MEVTIDIPEVLRAALERKGMTDLSRAAVEALVIEGYRTGKLSAGQVAEALDLGTSVGALEWLGRRGIAMNYTLEDLEEDRKTLDRLLGHERAARKGSTHP